MTALFCCVIFAFCDKNSLKKYSDMSVNCTKKKRSSHLLWKSQNHTCLYREYIACKMTENCKSQVKLFSTFNTPVKGNELTCAEGGNCRLTGVLNQGRCVYEVHALNSQTPILKTAWFHRPQKGLGAALRDGVVLKMVKSQWRRSLFQCLCSCLGGVHMSDWSVCGCQSLVSWLFRREHVGPAQHVWVSVRNTQWTSPTPHTSTDPVKSVFDPRLSEEGDTWDHWRRP